MKAILFYLTAVMIILTVCTMELSAKTLLMILADTYLVSICYQMLSLRDIMHYTGYDIWYKMLK